MYFFQNNFSISVIPTCTIGKQACVLILNCYSQWAERCFVEPFRYYYIYMQIGEVPLSPTCNISAAAFSCDSHLPLLLPPTLPALLRSHRSLIKGIVSRALLSAFILRLSFTILLSCYLRPWITAVVSLSKFDNGIYFQLK